MLWIEEYAVGSCHTYKEDFCSLLTHQGKSRPAWLFRTAAMPSHTGRNAELKVFAAILWWGSPAPCRWVTHSLVRAQSDVSHCKHDPDSTCSALVQFRGRSHSEFSGRLLHTTILKQNSVGQQLRSIPAHSGSSDYTEWIKNKRIELAHWC